MAVAIATLPLPAGRLVGFFEMQDRQADPKETSSSGGEGGKSNLQGFSNLVDFLKEQNEKIIFEHT